MNEICAIGVTRGGRNRPSPSSPPLWRPTLAIGRLIAARPGETCERNRANSPLVDGDWTIVALKGETLAPVEGRREASFILRSGRQRRASVTVGCNRMPGDYETTERGGLKFGRLAGAMMGCPPPLDARERALSEVLESTRAYAIAGSTLVFYDDKLEIVAVLQSVTLR